MDKGKKGVKEVLRPHVEPLLLMSESWYKDSNTHSSRMLVVGEERTRPSRQLFSVSTLYFLQYFDTVG